MARPKNARQYTMTNPAAYHVPDDASFGDEAWLVATDLREIADRLIEKHPELHHLYDWHVEFFWRRKGGEAGGHLTLGKCAKVGGIARALAPDADFVVWLAADHLRETEATTYQVTGYVFHELLHTTTDDKGRPALRGHDWMGFDVEIREFGLYDSYLEAAGTAFAQLALVSDGGQVAADGD